LEEARITILIVDDEELLRRGVSRKMQSEGYDCVEAADGKQALEAALKHDIALALMDINMPGMSGLEVLAQMTEKHSDTVVVMLTAAVDTETAVEAVKRGACDYMTKPFDLNALSVRVKKALERRRLLLENREYGLRLEKMVEEQVGQIQQYYNEAMQALAREGMTLQNLSGSLIEEHKADHEEVYLQMARTLALVAEMREPYLHGRQERVSVLADRIAHQLGCPEEMIKDICLAAIVHDIGKIVIPEHILFKPDNLTPGEYSEIQRHPIAAVDIMRETDYFKGILGIIECQHEWYNGEGYPNNIKGDSIPLEARILAVADAYDAMTSPRPHRPGFSENEAIEILKKGAGEQWDPVIVDVFLRILQREYNVAQAHPSP